mmetsp:Transcript_14979/g.34478  ORF Transcript_14979/g.34478 Transcript_14979/m.34478 type:complete len:176 (-) Transcript_14979:9-536(-)
MTKIESLQHQTRFEVREAARRKMIASKLIEIELLRRLTAERVIKDVEEAERSRSLLLAKQAEEAERKRRCEENPVAYEERRAEGLGRVNAAEEEERACRIASDTAMVQIAGKNDCMRERFSLTDTFRTKVNTELTRYVWPSVLEERNAKAPSVQHVSNHAEHREVLHLLRSLREF